MIRVIVERNSDGMISAFQMDGHADFAEHGKDLVCAGASAVSFGAVNAVFSLTSVEPAIEQGEDGGYLRVEFPQHMDQAEAGKVQLIMESMIVSLETIQQEYGQYIKITFK
ncbi:MULTISPECIES: ribosomal-processing cysteine protease Prp [Jeotgalibacillus]|uniref:ribosomal-processing cysteine protease Prp n=1 Tax=Jeotgalibacillus TaxID=157226 RepID=UPI00106AE325|nr:MULTISPECIES: ribosomal-processing cysteine protease Prp [Jeotgalibacillus]TFD92407.1 ribosomal-processing cysteine protease Prp [Jeotgalibacillus sp. R-1-5s-1]